MPYTPLNPETRGKLLSALNDVARVVFPRLLSPLDAVAEAVYSGGEFRLQLDDLPSDVIAGILERGGDQKVVLGKHILDHNRNAAAFRLPLNEILWPVLMDTCHNLDTASLRVLWDTMIESRIEQRLIADVMLNLAEEFCETPWSFRKQPAQIAEISIFRNVWEWPSPMPPSLAHAVAEAMMLALDTRTLPANEVLKWALRLGRIGLARRAILTGDDEATPPNNLDQRICRFCCLSGTMEGLIHFVGDHLYAYVDNLEEYEQRYFSPEELVPKLSELRQLAGGAPGMPESGRRQESEDHGLSRWRSSVEKYLVYRENIYAAIPHLIAAFFYVDRDTFLSHQTQRLVEQAERWLCYWTCNGHRYGMRQSSFNPDQVAAQELRLKVVQVWHEGFGAKQLLANVRRMLDQPPCRRWTEVLAEGSSRTEYEYILPCWLLELRALRMHGRDTPEWAEADRLTATRLSHLVGAYSIPDNWSRDPGFSLFLLELLRQVAVSRSRPNEAGASDAEILKSARHVLVRLEMIDCPGVRRTLCGFLHPILTAIAAWRTRTHADPAEGLCLFQMARSRWMIDQLALENRTLVVRAQDDELSRTLKDKLFQELNQEGMPASASHWQAPSATLVRNLRRDAPDLCRLVLSNWLNPDVMKSLPNEAAVLTFEMEHDPADPPRLCIAKSSESWSAFAPGIDSQLWTFVAGRGHVAGWEPSVPER